MSEPHIKIRIPEIDKLMKEANDKHMQVVSSDMTSDEKKYLKDLSEEVNKDIKYVNSIVNEVFHYMEKRGCDVSKYI